MNGKYVLPLAMVIIASVIVAAGVGYALYSGSSTSGEIDAEPTQKASVDIYVNDGSSYSLLETSLTVPAISPEEQVIEGYYLYVEGDRSQSNAVRLWCDMGYTQSWVFIEDMYLVIDGIDDPCHFGVGEISSQRVTNLPTDALAGLDDGDYHYFSIHIVYTDVEPSYDAEGQKYASFEGSRFVFAFDDSDPLGH